MDDFAVVRIPETLRDRIRREANERGQTIQEFTARALELAVKKARTGRLKRERRELNG